MGKDRINLSSLKDKVYENFLVSEDKKYFKNFIKTLKSSSALKEQYDFYHTIENTKFSDRITASKFLDNTLRNITEAKTEKMVSENKKLQKVFGEELKSAKKTKLQEDMETVLFDRQNENKNLKVFFESYNRVLDRLVTENEDFDEDDLETENEGMGLGESEIEDEYNGDDIIDEEVIKMAEKNIVEEYMDKLPVEERRILDVFTSNNKQKQTKEFNKLKENVLLEIEKVMFDSPTKDDFKLYKESYEKIHRMVYEKPDDYFTLIDLKS